MICVECNNGYVVECPVNGVCPECYDMNYNNSGHGFEELDEAHAENNREYDDYEDDYENDNILEQQEREDFDETDEAYGRYSDCDYDEPYDNDCDLWNES